MLDFKFSIGGQFQEDKKIFYDKSVRVMSEMIFDGASSSLRFIIKKLNLKNDEYVLLPSYLCPTIIENFDKMNTKVIFYAINYDFSINLIDLKRKLCNNKVKAIYFIEYFGMNHNEETMEFLKFMKLKGYTIIQDAVHTLYLDKYDGFIGTYCFNSLRKFGPIDGSVLLSYNNVDMEKNYNEQYLKSINKARKRKSDYFKGEFSDENIFLDEFKKAEEFYQDNKEICMLSSEQQKKLEKLNLNYIKKRRIENFQYLYKFFEQKENIKIITTNENIENKIPFTMIILINNRNEVRKKLFDKRIFCPILWDIINCEQIKGFEDSLKISKQILMIPIDQRYTIYDMKTFIKIFDEIV